MICPDCKNTGIKLNGASCYNNLHEEDERNKDVHTEHCCFVHGCKYGYDTNPSYKFCTVADGSKQQSYPCESCAWARQEGYDRMENTENGLIRIPSTDTFLGTVMEMINSIEHNDSMPPDYQLEAHLLRVKYDKFYRRTS